MNALMILSGGMDSVTMLHEYRNRIGAAVFFDYGSNHNRREQRCAEANCRALGVPLTVIPLAFIGEHFKSALLSGADSIPLDGEYNAENMSATVVPLRNGIMLTVAAGLAESMGLDSIMIANHAGDHAIYPDCRPQFVDAMAEAIRLGTDTGIRLEAPYTNLSKADIARRGAALGVDYTQTYSCYLGGEHHCGRCATCIERRQALEAAGLPWIP